MIVTVPVCDRLVPAVGLCAMTDPAGSVDCANATATLNPARSRIVVAEACERPMTEGTLTWRDEVGVVQVSCGSIPAMNCRVLIFAGSVNWLGRQYGVWVMSTATDT